MHALFLGFVMSMVMGHAPIILPAVLRTPLPYHASAWVPLGLLHASVALRVGADLAGSDWLRGYAAHGNVSALLLFVVLGGVLADLGEVELHAATAAGHSVDGIYLTAEQIAYYQSIVDSGQEAFTAAVASGRGRSSSKAVPTVSSSGYGAASAARPSTDRSLPAARLPPWQAASSRTPVHR